MAYANMRIDSVENLGVTLTVQQTSDLLHVHSNTLRRWNDAGLLPAYRIGPRGDRRFRREDVVQFLEQFNPYKLGTK